VQQAIQIDSINVMLYTQCDRTVESRVREVPRCVNRALFKSDREALPSKTCWERGWLRGI